MKKIILTIFTITINNSLLFAEEVATEISKTSAGNEGLPLGIIGTILGAIALALACFIFINLSKRLSKSESDKKKNNVLLARVKILEENNKKLEDRIIRLERIINTTKVESIHKSSTPSQTYPSHTVPVSCQDVNIKSDSYAYEDKNYHRGNVDIEERKPIPYQEEIKKTENSQPKEEPMKLINYFVGIPIGHEGVFTNIEDEFIPGETFFLIKTMDGKQGSIDFINRKETIAVASRNLSRWVNPVCDIIGNMPDSLTKIITKQPGIVEKTNSGWKIVKKAVVELS